MPKPVKPALPETQILPDPSLEKRSRRIFTLAYKLRILAEADTCKRGELGKLLRREKLYSGQLQQWRREQAEQGDAGLAKSAPGPKASHTVQDRLIERLEKEITQLQRRLCIATDCLDLQKKALSMLDHLNSGSAA